MKTKVIRAPRKPAAGKLAPLIAGEFSDDVPPFPRPKRYLAVLFPTGVIERRRQARRNNTADGINGANPFAGGTANNTTGVNTPKSGFDRVKLRGGGVPERRITSTGGAQTPRTANGSPDSTAFHIPNDERRPLLK